MEDGGRVGVGMGPPRSALLLPSEPPPQQRGCKRPRLSSAEGGQQSQGQPSPQAQRPAGGASGRQARMRVVVAAAIVAFVFAGCCLPPTAGFQVGLGVGVDARVWCGVVWWSWSDWMWM